MKKILLVEDEKGISDIVTSYLSKEGFEVIQMFNGRDAVSVFESSIDQDKPIDLVILDLMLPKLSGEKVIEHIRGISRVPVIMLTAKVNEEDRIAGFKRGADDYITKPFSPRELVERVKAVLRRSEPAEYSQDDTLSLNNGRLKLNFENYSCIKDGEEISLTGNEYKILKTLYSAPGKIFTREEIISIAFGMDYDAFDRAIDTHIKNIRHKIDDNPKDSIYIKTVYGVGYKAGGLDEAAN